MICYHIIYKIFFCFCGQFQHLGQRAPQLRATLGHSRWSTHWLRAIFNLLHFNITHLPYEPPSRVMREQTAHFAVWTAGFPIRRHKDADFNHRRVSTWGSLQWVGSVSWVCFCVISFIRCVWVYTCKYVFCVCQVIGFLNGHVRSICREMWCLQQSFPIFFVWLCPHSSVCRDEVASSTPPVILKWILQRSFFHTVGLS